MFRIPSSFWEATQASMTDDFVTWMIKRLRKFFPDECASLTDHDLGDVVRHGIDAARSYGLDREVCVCHYIDLMFLFGIDFDLELDWASAILTDEGIEDQGEVIDTLWAAAMGDIAVLAAAE